MTERVGSKVIRNKEMGRHVLCVWFMRGFGLDCMGYMYWGM